MQNIQSEWIFPSSRQEPRMLPFPATFDPYHNSLNQPPSPPPPPFINRGPVMAPPGRTSPYKQSYTPLTHPPAPLSQSFSNGPLTAPHMSASPYNHAVTPLRRPPAPSLPATVSQQQVPATTPTETSGVGFDETKEPSSPLVTELWEADLDSEVWKRQLDLWKKGRKEGTYY
ncbi:hypothetical protein MMC18_008758 [Xylographa bjoerkii]|nr:hypothetical protein [Xylographa bjoerkii]